MSLALAGCGSPPPPPPFTFPPPPRPDAVVSIAPLRQAPTGLQLRDAQTAYGEPEEIKPQDTQLLEVRRHQELIQSGQETMACMNVPAARCLASLATIARVRMFPRPEQTLFGDTPPDLTGRPGLAASIELDVLTNGSSTHKGPAKGTNYGVSLIVDEGPERNVQSIRIIMVDAQVMLFAARTEEEFDRYQIYDLFRLIFARTCPGLDRKKLYEFLYLDVFDSYNAGASASRPTANHVPGEFCGYAVHKEVEVRKIKLNRQERYWAEKHWRPLSEISEYIVVKQLGNK
ncbi:hypothetical protein [Nitrospirillum sp. BR 11828]|uniref:hypothetical protein n=1 Tax=Nitrospirillum sp. BR 11828 TaxID=3104325 RepID=UPI002ACA5723|nr:hypothetical protein [Nitrospirillum sp. BR 11828]MDZ5648948.1 hypothetical protein [Nitrospirillum sp. BR 11828]